MPLSVVFGTVVGLLVRFWRYRPKTWFVVRDIAFGLVSMVTLWHLLPSEIGDMWSFMVAYFSAQSASHGGSVLIKK